MPDFYRLTVDETLRELNADADAGLTDADVAGRQAQVGRNTLPREQGATVLKLFLQQFANLMVVILLAAAVISFLLGDYKDVVIILIIAILNAVIGTYQEYQAEQALAALSAMQVPQVRVRRDGSVHQVSAEELVPGDIVMLGEGDRIPADGRLIETANLQLEEAALTGESQPVEKNTDALSGDDSVGIGDRKNMAFMGTSVNYGRGEMVVTGTGLKTELGKIASMLMSVGETKTPLQKRIDSLGRLLVYGAIGIIALVFVVGLLRGIPVQAMLITAISLAVAAVPEGLPAIITIGLSLGAARMVKRNALIRRLPAVETLGSVTTICSDKTGTLTKNEMTATVLALPGHPDVTVTGIGYGSEGDFLENGERRLDPTREPIVGRFLKSMALATDAYLEADEHGKVSVVGDTTEGALLVAAQKVGWTRENLEHDAPRINELPFSSERKAMTTVHRLDDSEEQNLYGGAKFISITKGAPDRLIEWATQEHMPDGTHPLTDDRRDAWMEQVDKMAARGLRVLGVAYRALEYPPDAVTPDIERELTLIGLVGILDPARPEARAAVQTAKNAGIRSIMITGDHALTAEAIATDLGILPEGQHAITGAQIDKMSEQELAQAVRSTSAFARVSPEHKLRLVKTLQAQNQIVAMTGDGVNDAPALKQADIGVAMGITGTEVSKGAADMVLTDDNFASIVAAVEEGRIIYDNIRKFVRYLLSSNIGEILVMFVALLVGWPIPLLAIQILWVNLVTDGLPAIALGFEQGEPGVMKRKPRGTDEGIFAGGLGRRIIVMATILAVLTLGGYVWAYETHGMDPFQSSLGLEKLDAAALTNLVGPELVPANWDSLDTAGRLERLTATSGDAFALEAGDENPITAAAERVPRTIAFMVLSLGQIFQVIAIHAGSEESFFRVWFSKNKFMLWAVVSTLALQLLVVYFSPLQHAFETVSLSGGELVVSVLLASLMLFIAEGEKLIRGRKTA